MFLFFLLVFVPVTFRVGVDPDQDPPPNNDSFQVLQGVSHKVLLSGKGT